MPGRYSSNICQMLLSELSFRFKPLEKSRTFVAFVNEGVKLGKYIGLSKDFIVAPVALKHSEHMDLEQRNLSVTSVKG